MTLPQSYHLRQVISITALLVVVTLFNVSSVEATVSYGEASFESMPATFGMHWKPPSRTYPAHLQVLSNNTKLCDDQGLDGLIKPTNDSLPVVLLVERGDCSFEQKSRLAMQQYPEIAYMVVYDDTAYKTLVSMRETESGEGVHLGLLFISHQAGLILRVVLGNQTEEVLAGGGPVIQLDGLYPDIYDDSTLADLQTWILIAMGGFFTFITVFGILLVLAQLGILPVNRAGQIILTPDAIRRSRRLMTIDEVARLQSGGDLHGKTATRSDDETQPTTMASTPLSNTEERGEEAVTPNNDASENADADVNDIRIQINVIQTEVHSHPHDDDDIDDEAENSCAVCLDELLQDSEYAADATLCLPCNHHFHLQCIIPWLTERQGTCPLCKFDVMQYIMDADDKESATRVNESWYKRHASRFMRFGWSPVAIEGSDSESQPPGGSITSSEHSTIEMVDSNVSSENNGNTANSSSNNTFPDGATQI